MLLMSVSIVAGCQCKDHAWVHLHDPTREFKTRVKIDAAVGRAIVSELSGSPSPHAEAVDLLQAGLTAVGAHAERVELRCSDGVLSGVLCLRGLNGPATTTVDPCHALLAACRMKLPILMHEVDLASVAETPVPSVYRPFLDTLDLSGLDGPSHGRASA